ncbi:MULTISPECIES: hypothetical protein [unclassified Moorena]|uniref:hypothetical protein n=1 Tax=unclassified Moorena TaxID=2683338 RepID=UPI0013C8D60C|nr:MULTISPECIES: hypothetical protein [unclassified Moorena]NEO19778.1 hypothetical protein [Moorena sp. SIO4A5]NEQ56630.1 hypothetical protein [Moorena sp. SIO4A1]
MAKKYWEFLLQKEGERSWKPIKSSEMEIESGRYRIVARSNLPNTDVEICVSYDSTEQVPPKRKSQRRWRRTNSEGLMVVIPFTKLKPGLWKLRCSNDIMDDFLGQSWRKSLALQVIPEIQDVETPPKTSVSTPVESTPVESTPVESTQTDTQPPQINNSLTTPELAVDSPSTNTIANDLKATDASSDTSSDASSDARSEFSNPQEYQSQITPPEEQPITIAAPELPVDQAQAAMGVSQQESSPSQETVLEEVEEVYSEAPVNPETNQQPKTNQQPIETISEDLQLQSTVENSIMEESLETLEQLLQQVLQPVLDELEDTESEDNQQLRKTSDSDWVSDTEVNKYGLTLKLDKEIFLARRGESLTIKGELIVYNDNYNNGDGITVSVLDSVLENLFPATLRYQLRFPQTGKRLLDIEYSLSQQELSLGFSHSLDIPTDCQSGLILGKITLYNSKSTALATQQFTVTANVEDLLEVIVPGNQGMPMETMVVLANRIAQSAKPDQPDQDLLLLDEDPLEQTTLDLVELPQNHPSLFLQPISKRSLPPKLYHHQPSDITVKSIKLPNFPTMQSVAEPEAQHEDVQHDSKASESVSLDDQESSTTANPELDNRQQDTGSELQPQETVLQDTVVQERVLQDTVLQNTVEQSEDSAEDTNEDSNLQIKSEVLSNYNDASEVLINSLNKSDPIQSIEIIESDEYQTDDQLEDSESVDTQFNNSKVNQLLNTTRWETPDSVQDPESIALEEAFRALNMEERFWSRLSALAEDDKLLELLRLELSPQSNPAGQDPSAVADKQRNETASNQGEVREFPEKVLESMTESEDLPIVSSELATPETPPRVGITSHDWTTQEIVVDDREIAPQPKKAKATKQDDLKAKLENLSSLELDATLAAPTLSIPTTRELVAGEKIMVTIKLPPSQSRLCIKLWVKDVQTRSLLQETRSIIDLLPNAAGELEAMTQLVIPQGTTQIRIEAIAINLENQQESHKAELECVVVPTDLSSTLEG